jgi:hypothetical protein
MKRNSDIDSADLEVLVIPDQRYFQMQGERAKRLTVDLEKVRDTQNSGFALDGSPFAYLRSHGGKAPFSFGMQSFRLRVLRSAPLGNAPVALSFWADGKPIDEVAMNLCVVAKPEDACPTSSASSTHSLRGVDLSGKGNLPDAALHLIERGSDVVGVFRCNSCAGDKYFNWTIGQRSFFSAAHAKGTSDKPSTLFVRLLSNKPNLVLFPMGLVRVPLPGGSKDFLGFSVNIEAPLELQDYSTQSKCISDWVLFVPPAGRNDEGSWRMPVITPTPMAGLI